MCVSIYYIHTYIYYYLSKKYTHRNGTVNIIILHNLTFCVLGFSIFNIILYRHYAKIL